MRVPDCLYFFHPLRREQADKVRVRTPPVRFRRLPVPDFDLNTRGKLPLTEYAPSCRSSLSLVCGGLSGIAKGRNGNYLVPSSRPPHPPRSTTRSSQLTPTLLPASHPCSPSSNEDQYDCIMPTGSGTVNLLRTCTLSPISFIPYPSYLPHAYRPKTLELILCLPCR